MKTNLKNALIPMAVIVMGIAGAFASNAATKTLKRAPAFGYIQLANGDCQKSIQCDQVHGVLCKSGTTQLYILDVPTQSCTVQMWRTN